MAPGSHRDAADAATPWDAPVDPAEREAAERLLRDHPTLHALLGAGAEVLDVVIQDEFTHDVVARVPTPIGALLLVFDST
jgi:hypothetical protein